MMTLLAQTTIEREYANIDTVKTMFDKPASEMTRAERGEAYVAERAEKIRELERREFRRILKRKLLFWRNRHGFIELTGQLRDPDLKFNHNTNDPCSEYCEVCNDYSGS